MKPKPRRLFHGSRAELAVGDYLLPARTLGLPDLIKTPNQPRYSPLFVHLTERLDYAAVFAADTGHIYEVIPVGPLHRDPDARQSWRCPRARVVRVVR